MALILPPLMFGSYAAGIIQQESFIDQEWNPAISSPYPAFLAPKQAAIIGDVAT
jgi:hypothetical protein